MPSPTIRTKHKIVAGLEAELLKRVRVRNGMSRIELARELHLAPSTAGIYVDRLVRKGFLLEGERVDRRYGRRPTLLTVNPSAGKFVGVDFEARSVMTTVIDFSSQVTSRSHRSIPKGESVERILKRIGDAIDLAVRDDSGPLLGIGVGIPGMIDAARGLASYYEFVPGWTNVPVVERLAERFKVDIHLENNIRSMAMAELWLGQGRGLRNFVCLGIRTGIGVGVLVNGELLGGTRGAAGEIGTWPNPVSDISFGRDSTLESAASLNSILAAAEKVVGRKMDFVSLKAAVDVSDRKVLEVLDRAALVHGAVIRQLDLLLDPERVIIAGPLAELGVPFLRSVTMAAGPRIAGGAPIIVNSSFGSFCGAVGAAALALHRWKPERGGD